MRAERLNIRLTADPKKVVLIFFKVSKERCKRILERLFSLNPSEMENSLEQIYKEFSSRHKKFEDKLLVHFKNVEKCIEANKKVSDKTKLLIGAYFSKEYSIESAALFNPSVVPHPNQEGLAEGELKFVMSLRATGEGHISSIEFREGIISADGNVSLINDSTYKLLARKHVYSRQKILKKKLSGMILSEKEIDKIREANYKCKFADHSIISERVMFPSTEAEIMGLEDARFVKFHDKGTSKYYGTYTAYNGKTFRTQIIETKDFQNFEIGTLHGHMVKDKGMALFPRKINGKYFMTSRQDGENLYMMESTNIYSWEKAERILEPHKWWGFIQVGNCGSPIETEKGWILLTHEVGPLRTYVISAILLDLENPYKVIGRLNEPLLEPREDEREGYVPNVVYSCGSIVHNGNLIIPYAMSDAACGFAKVELNQLLQNLS